MLELFAGYSFLAVLTERITEAVFGVPFERIAGLEPYKWALVYLSFAVGVGLAFQYQLDMVAALLNDFGLALPATVFGTVLTGLAIGGGSQLLHQVWPGSPDPEPE